MQIETILSAIEKNCWSRHRARERDTERGLRQYHAFRERILEMEAEKQECILMLREERNQLREALTILDK